jgi:hypothetical protein
VLLITVAHLHSALTALALAWVNLAFNVEGAVHAIKAVGDGMCAAAAPAAADVQQHQQASSSRTVHTGSGAALLDIPLGVYKVDWRGPTQKSGVWV